MFLNRPCCEEHIPSAPLREQDYFTQGPQSFAEAQRFQKVQRHAAKLIFSYPAANILRETERGDAGQTPTS
jgi:hypothetical protein